MELRITAAKAPPSLRLFAVPSPLSCVVGGGGASGKCNLFPNTLYKGITIRTSAEKSVTVDLIGVLSLYPLDPPTTYSHIHPPTSSNPHILTPDIHLTPFFAEQRGNDWVVHPYTHKPTSTHPQDRCQVAVLPVPPCPRVRFLRPPQTPDRLSAHFCRHNKARPLCPE